MEVFPFPGNTEKWIVTTTNYSDDSPTIDAFLVDTEENTWTISGIITVGLTSDFEEIIQPQQVEGNWDLILEKVLRDADRPVVGKGPSLTIFVVDTKTDGLKGLKAEDLCRYNHENCQRTEKVWSLVSLPFLCPIASLTSSAAPKIGKNNPAQLSFLLV